MKKRNSTIALLGVAALLIFGIITLVAISQPQEDIVNDKDIDVQSLDDALNIQVEVLSYAEDDEGNVTINYQYTISNNSEYKFTNVVALSNLAEKFAPYNFTIDSFGSSDFDLNSNFDGDTNYSLLAQNYMLNANETGTINLTVTLDANGDRGPFANAASISGEILQVVSPTTGQDGSGADGNDDGATQPGPIIIPDQEINPESITYYLIDSTTDQTIREIQGNEIIDFNALNTQEINIIAVIGEGTGESIVFSLNGNNTYRVENNAPYSLGGDTGGDYVNWGVGNGTYQIQGTVFSQDSGLGDAVASKYLTITIINRAIDNNIDNDEDSVEVTLPQGQAESKQNNTNSNGNVNTLPNTNANNAQLAQTGFEAISGLYIAILGILSVVIFKITDRFIYVKSS